MSARETALAAAVRARRKELGLRQEELADLAGVSERFVFAVESGKASVRLDKLMDLLGALGLHLQLQRGRAEGVRAGAGVDG
jgi:y4mF family transcriptional regulator